MLGSATITVMLRGAENPYILLPPELKKIREFLPYLLLLEILILEICFSYLKSILSCIDTLQSSCMALAPKNFRNC